MTQVSQKHLDRIPRGGNPKDALQALSGIRKESFLETELLSPKDSRAVATARDGISIRILFKYIFLVL